VLVYHELSTIASDQRRGWYYFSRLRTANVPAKNLFLTLCFLQSSARSSQTPSSVWNGLAIEDDQSHSQFALALASNCAPRAQYLTNNKPPAVVEENHRSRIP
jgi:hypothetical protein